MWVLRITVLTFALVACGGSGPSARPGTGGKAKNPGAPGEVDPDVIVVNPSESIDGAANPSTGIPGPKDDPSSGDSIPVPHTPAPGSDPTSPTGGGSQPAPQPAPAPQPVPAPAPSGGSSFTYTVSNQRDKSQSVSLVAPKIGSFTCEATAATTKTVSLQTSNPREPGVGYIVWYYDLPDVPYGGEAGIVAVGMGYTDLSDSEWSYDAGQNSIKISWDTTLSVSYKVAGSQKLEYSYSLGTSPKLISAYDKNTKASVQLSLQSNKVVLDPGYFTAGRQIEFKYASGNTATTVNLDQSPIAGSVKFSDGSCASSNVSVSGKSVTINCLSSGSAGTLQYKYSDVSMQAFKFSGSFNPGSGSFTVENNGKLISNFRVVGDMIYVDDLLPHGSQVKITYHP